MILSHLPDTVCENMRQPLPEPRPPGQLPAGLSLREGALAFSGRPARIFEAIDREARRFAVKLGAEEVILPSSISVEDLQRCSYLERFPQMIRVHSAFRPEPGDGGTSACCSAACLSSFPCFQDKVIPGSGKVWTTRGLVFRNEAGQPTPQRLTEFHVRETVFYGSPEFVRENLLSCVAWLEALLQEGGLRGVLGTASDPFYPAVAGPLLAYQSVMKPKFELRLGRGGEAELTAVSSVNDHGSHFAKAFQVRLSNGDFAHTGCFGVGLERLTLALFEQYGELPSEWPASLRRRFGGDTGQG